ncbi:MAG: NTP transferase domain-containing protein [Kiritimatiellae bacterium]|nr:NTP transferase domain-containing protein [Kiritimatiellia bacterium]MCO5060723.1 NTP transferase domain-containing protein [Kiritimatiellia bacterium]MCO5068884.1 NTP transferase domain-containing protein [Kiritimatiellia bacterium]MCO6399916.1 NTP transferase domain-containing protein [Verrucomicrobiota bacterium]
MQIVILAGGLGTRLRELDPLRPKALMPVAGRPFLDWQLELLKRNALTDVVLSIGHLGEQIEAFVKDGSAWGLRVRYARENPRELRGTGGALVHALPLLAEEFLMIYGDSYLPIPFAPVVGAFRNAGAPALMTVFRNRGAWDKSNARVEGNRVVFYSKTARPGEADWIDYGLIAFRRSVIERYQTAPVPLDMAAILSDLVAAGDLAAYEAPERFYEIGKPEGLRELEAVLSEGRA